MLETEKRARKAVRSKLRAGTYTMPPLDHVASTDQFHREVDGEIERQVTAHLGVPVDRDSMTFRDLPEAVRDEYYAYHQIVWQKWYPTYQQIMAVERERWQAVQAERNRDRPRRWWPSVGGFREVAIRDDGSLWNPNNYPEADVRAAIAAAEARIAERKRESIKRGVEKRARRREERIWKAADIIRRNEGIGRRDTCYCCNKLLTDPVSIERGIGPECWEHVLQHVERRTMAASSS